MKGILLSIKPKYVAKILNGEKTIEIRKKFPSDYVGWVYIYCTKWNKNECLIPDLQPDKVYHPLTEKLHRGVYSIVEENAIWNDCKKYILNGKVVARFWCDKVEEIACEQLDNGVGKDTFFYTDSVCDITKDSCLETSDLINYLGISMKDGGIVGYAIHITNLEIFDKPKEIKEFRRYCDKHFSWWTNRCLDCKAYTPDTDIEDYCNKNKLALTRAPQSYCFIEV